MFKEYHQRFLKVKIKSLAAESKMIRLEEKKTRDTFLKSHLQSHRIWDVRRESRAAQLAYAYLRGHPLSVVEGKAHRDFRVDKRALQIVKKFGTLEGAEKFPSWISQ